ncbi:hypothetical protein A33M_1746 [Rhodovulum sp. PH10]|nr:hypothetical protein A33M_1746 [Rhodovulum sp. PH10]
MAPRRTGRRGAVFRRIPASFRSRALVCDAPSRHGRVAGTHCRRRFARSWTPTRARRRGSLCGGLRCREPRVARPAAGSARDGEGPAGTNSSGANGCSRRFSASRSR